MMLGIFTGLLSSPMAILAMLAVFVGTSVFGEVKGWMERREAIAPWAVAVAERDQWSAQKDKITEIAIQETEKATNEIQQLRAALDEAEIARKLVKAPDCVWSDDDIELLNNAKAARHRPGS